MNHRKMFQQVRLLLAVWVGCFWVSAAFPQQMADSINGRYLLIFDTSSAMKKRISATQNAVERLFFSMMNGQLRPGDTIGVWTFNRKLRAGDFPLQHWLPQNAAPIATSITNFVAHQHYSKSTRFEAIMPDVNKLVQSSKRLTVLIFCDGRGEIKGTPFDKTINGIFSQNEPALRKANQTYIVVLRSQFGHYTGYTVNSSAVGVSFPQFPPLPSPPPPPPPQSNPPPVKVETNPPRPVIHLPPLVIVGTNVSTNMIRSIPPQKESSNSPSAGMATNLPTVKTQSNALQAIAVPTNSSSAFSPPVTKSQTVPLVETNAQTNALAAAGKNPPGTSRRASLVIGAALLSTAVALIGFALIFSRKPDRGSLISRAMKKK